MMEWTETPKRQQKIHEMWSEARVPDQSRIIPELPNSIIHAHPEWCEDRPLSRVASQGLGKMTNRSLEYTPDPIYNLSPRFPGGWTEAAHGLIQKAASPLRPALAWTPMRCSPGFR